MRVVQFGKMCLIGRTDIDYPCRRSLHRWPAPSSSRWQVGKVEGFNVGPGPILTVGGQGATVEATVCLQYGATVPIVVAGQGGLADDDLEGGGSGRFSAVCTNGDNTSPTIVAGRVLAQHDKAPNLCRMHAEKLH